MAKVVFGNHSSVLVPRHDRDRIRQFYGGVLGGELTLADPDRDLIRLGEDFYIAFLYGDVADESEFLRSARSVWLEIKSDDVEELIRKSSTSVSGSSRYRTRTSISRLREANACAWSESTRISPFMRGPRKARTSLRPGFGLH